MMDVNLLMVYRLGELERITVSMLRDKLMNMYRKVDTCLKNL